MNVFAKLFLITFFLCFSALSRQEKLKLEQYRGDFVSKTSEMKLTIRYRDSVLFAQAAGNPEFRIYKKAEHEFFGKKVDIVFKFHMKSDTVHSLTAERMGQTYEFSKLK